MKSILRHSMRSDLGRSNSGMLTWAEIDLRALAHNFNLIKTKTNCEIMPVIKANAYGHGIVKLSKIFSTKLKVKKLGLAKVSEGVMLRSEGVLKPSLVILGGFCKGEIPDIVKYNLEPSVFSTGEINALNKEAIKKRKKVGVHLKINTGMNRLGVRPEESEKMIGQIAKCSHLNLKTVYTHLSDADCLNDTKTAKQIKALCDVGMPVGVKIHAASSAAIAKYPFTYFDIVRPGIMLYGSFGEKTLKNKVPVKPVMTLKSRVIHVATLKKGEAVSYGSIYRAKQNEKIAIVGIGYGDGLHRSLSGKGYFIINGKKCGIIGRVCMDMTAVKIKGDVKIGDEVLVFGKSGKNKIDVEDVAALAGTVSYEIFTGITERVTKVYKNSV